MKNPRAKHNFVGRPCSISGVGSYVPERILTNADLEKLVETTDEWITTRTGIKERRIAAANEFTSDLATKAAERAMKMAGIAADQIDLIIVATLTPDMPFPSTACLVQRKLGAARAAAFDIEAACSGFIYALEIGQQFILSRTYETVLVIGAEKLSSIVNWKDRNTCVLFGDGAFEPIRGEFNAEEGEDIVRSESQDRFDRLVFDRFCEERGGGLGDGTALPGEADIGDESVFRDHVHGQRIATGRILGLAVMIGMCKLTAIARMFGMVEDDGLVEGGHRNNLQLTTNN